jgi:hypothetical protein
VDIDYHLDVCASIENETETENTQSLLKLNLTIY